MTDYREKIKYYVELEKTVLDGLNHDAINQVMNLLEETRLAGNRIFICGNGGSAATASHFVCDFNKGVSFDHNKELKYDFECLSDNIPTMMAVANDLSYEDIFVVPLKNKLKKGDVVIGISGSGNSRNVVKALEYGNLIGADTVGIVGYDGGGVKNIAKYCIHVKVNNMQIAEDIHLMLDHMMMTILSEVD